jgi:hypothetical protein
MYLHNFFIYIYQLLKQTHITENLITFLLEIQDESYFQTYLLYFQILLHLLNY